MKTLRMLIASLMIPALSSANALAHEHEDEEGHRLGAHVHGKAQMAIVITGEDIDISVESPLHNILGFEHAPASPEEAEQVLAANDLLLHGDELFRFNAPAKCHQTEASNSLVLPGKEADESEAAESGAENPHRDLDADYGFACDHPDRLKSVSIRMFEKFPNLQTLEVVVFRDNIQHASELTADAPTLSLE